MGLDFSGDRKELETQFKHSGNFQSAYINQVVRPLAESHQVKGHLETLLVNYLTSQSGTDAERARFAKLAGDRQFIDSAFSVNYNSSTSSIFEEMVYEAANNHEKLVLGGKSENEAADDAKGPIMTMFREMKKLRFKPTNYFMHHATMYAQRYEEASAKARPASTQAPAKP